MTLDSARRRASKASAASRSGTAASYRPASAMVRNEGVMRQLSAMRERLNKVRPYFFCPYCPRPN